MRPSTSSLNSVNGLRVNAIHSRNGSEGCSLREKFTDRRNIRFGQLRLACSFTASNGVRACLGAVAVARSNSTLSVAVGHIFGLACSLKMIRTAARRVIAAMHDDHPIRDWAINKHPRYSVSKLFTFKLVALTIPTLDCLPYPFRASVLTRWFRYQLPKRLYTFRSNRDWHDPTGNACCILALLATAIRHIPSLVDVVIRQRFKFTALGAFSQFGGVRIFHGRETFLGSGLRSWASLIPHIVPQKGHCKQPRARLITVGGISK